jgi:hypothetical protein
MRPELRYAALGGRPLHSWRLVRAGTSLAVLGLTFKAGACLASDGSAVVLEKDIEAYLVRRVREHGGVAYKFTSPAHRGVADRVVCLPGQTWFVEVKRPGGRLTGLQTLFGREMQRLGQRYIVVWSKEEIDAWLSSC